MKPGLGSLKVINVPLLCLTGLFFHGAHSHHRLGRVAHVPIITWRDFTGRIPFLSIKQQHQNSMYIANTVYESIRRFCSIFSSIFVVLSTLFVIISIVSDAVLNIEAMVCRILGPFSVHQTRLFP